MWATFDLDNVVAQVPYHVIAQKDHFLSAMADMRLFSGKDQFQRFFNELSDFFLAFSVSASDPMMPIT